MRHRRAPRSWRFVALLCVVLPFCGAYAAAPGFGTARAGAVWGAALEFIAPRTLEPLGIPRMAVWGLSGITALDPDLTVQEQSGKLLLYGPNRIIFATAAPQPTDAMAWGDACAAVAARAFAVSPALERAGTEGVIRSFFDELFNHFDPYSRYEAPREAAQDRAMRLGHAGLGITLGREGSAVVVARVAPSSPADEAGIATGMVVLAIDGAATAGRHLAALQSRLRGPAGSSIALTVRPARSLPQTVRLTSGLVPTQTVFGSMNENIAMLRVIGFDRDTGEQFAAALGALMAGNPAPKGIVIDLRGNRGGLLRQSALSVDTLLGQGTIIRTVGRDPAADRLWRAEGGDLARGLPVVILVDGATASAAEVFSASLSDNDRAVVVGSATLGKGLVQSVTSLPGGGELFVTWSRMIAPRGWPLQGLGVFPELCTSLGTNSLAAQIASLKAGRDMLAKPLAETRAARAPMPLAEVLALRDSCPASVGSSGYFKAAKALIDDPVAYRAALIHPLIGAAARGA
ncbi:PDZ domain-containing protein [Acidiphilium sp. AL]|uniref:S41 family peptidase n=1 Tax=Acidiphilium sp. AL TaxID=2871704 RepID=UPI0021CB50DC|nr:S41 family peptidase [Acidiphilium sp. AL]MCU4161315.1 PDZ domain-containing protein [Acidiphilium sp. AL]